MKDQIFLISFQIVSLIYILPTTIVYFKKNKIMTIENTIYSRLLIIVLSLLIIDIVTIIGPLNLSFLFTFKIIRKLLYIMMIIWLSLITYYLNIHAIQEERTNFSYKIDPEKKLYKKIGIKYFIIIIISLLLVILLPLNLNINNNIPTYKGAIAYFVIGISTLLVLICIYYAILDYRKEHKRQYAPFWLLLVLIITTIILEKTTIYMNLLSPIISFSTIYMFFTLENPDISLIENLRIARKTSEKANVSKTELLLSISKDIKTPLNAISGFSNALKAENLDKKSTREAEAIYTASNQLLNIINEIIDISNIEKGNLKLNNTEYDVKKVFDDIASLGKVRLSNKNINFNYQISNSIPEVLFGDSRRIKQILLNIITNATKYTEEGYISFIVNNTNYADTCRLQIIVDDSGPGISKERQELILNTYNYIKITNNLNGLGTGYGLAITKKLIETMGGTFQMSSSAGRGTKIKIELEQKISSKKTDELIKPQRENDYFDASHTNVLVVDDNMVNLKVAKLFLKKYKINVDIINSGDGCIELVNQSNKYNIIFLDDQMPGLSGKETLRRLLTKPGFSSKVIALTSNESPNIREEYKQLGFTDYLKKPIDSNELHSILKKYIQNKNR